MARTTKRTDTPAPRRRKGAAKAPAKTGSAPRPRRRAADPKPINLALQGGGAHGAFTWGVLDAILADGRIEIDAVSGTSAGAMNAVVLADGLARGGRDEARARLERFWEGVSRNGAGVAVIDGIIDALFGFWRIPGFDTYGWLEQVSTLVSPYRANPLDINPLRHLLDELVDFERVRAAKSPKLFIAATNVRTGKGKIFTDGEITTAAVLASATLPYLFQAVEVDGEYYWDGGYTGNPPLWPFYTFATSTDILLVQVNPMHRDRIPLSSQEIMERVSEVTFNSSLLKELRAIDFVNRLMDEHRLDPAKYRVNRLHRIDATAALADYGAASKLDTNWDFFRTLKAAGAEAASAWLDAHFGDIGRRATLDLRAEFL